MKIKHLFLLAIPFLVLSGCSKADDDTPAAPHEHEFGETWVSDQNDHWKVCNVNNCDEISERAAHTFVLKEGSHQDATCEHPALDTYECKVCKYSKEVESGSKEAHSYVKSVKTEATCQTKGVYKFSCVNCDDSFEQEYEDHDAHNFVLDPTETVGNKKTYKCQNSGCTEKYTIIDYSSQKTAQVNTSDLQSAGAIKLQHADIAFEDSALASLGENVTISAEPKQASELGDVVSDEVKAKIGNNTIVDFSFKDGDRNVSSFDGALTITLPYTLKEGEDPEGIVIWYLADGIATPIEAKYRDGFVKFETTHFSLYTVVHLSVEEVCASFGHSYGAERKVESTCKAHGYVDHLCTRCRFTEREVLPLVAHKWEFDNKSEATHAHDGYIEYKCSVCEDKYRSVIEKLPANSQGFYLTLLKTFLNNDISFTGIESIGSMDVKVEGYKGTDLEGIPFVYARIPFQDDVYEVGQYKGYNLNGDFRRSKASSSFVNAFANIGEIFARFPNSVDDIAQKIGTNYIEQFFTKVEIPEGYSFTLNKAKIDKIFDIVESGTIRDLVDEIMGQEGYNKIIDWVSKAYNKTIAEVIEELGTKGYVVKELYDAAISIMQIVTQKQETTLPSFDELYEQYKDQKIIDVVNESLNKKSKTSQGQGGSNGAVSVIDGMELPEGVSLEDLDIEIPEDIDYPVGGGEAVPSPSMIPATYEEAKAMIDTYLEMKILDLAGQFGGMGMGGKVNSLGQEVPSGTADNTQIIQMIEMYREMMKKIDCSFIAGSNGDFISLSMSAKEIDYSAFQGNMDVEAKISLSLDAVKGFDKHEVCEYLERYNKYAERRDKAFELSASSFAWFTEPYEKTYNASFTYHENYFRQSDDEEEYYYGSSTDALISTEPVIKNVSVYDESKGEYVTVNARLVIGIVNEWKGSGSFVQNKDGLGTKLGAGEYGLIADSRSFTNIYLSYELSSDQEPEMIEHDENKYYFQYLYNLDTGIHYWTSGSFEYLNAHSWRYEVATKEEIGKYEPVEFLESDRVYIKKVCEDCGAVSISSTSVESASDWPQHVGEKAFLHKDMNDVALENYEKFANMHVYYSTDGFIYHLYQEGVQRNNDTASLSYGNAKVDISTKETSQKCKTNYMLTYYVNNKIVKTFTYQVHDFSDYTKFERKYETPCYTRVTEVRKCNCCGREYRYSYHYDYHHADLEVVKHVDATLTHDGYTVKHCKTCGEYVTDYDWRCDHCDSGYDERTGKYVCHNCGVEFESETLPNVFVEKVTDKNSGAYLEGYETYSYALSGRFPWDHYYIGTTALSHQMTVCYIENGEPVEVAGISNLNAVTLDYYDHYEVKSGYSTSYYGGVYMNLMRFESSAVEALMASAKAKAPGKQLYFAIKSVRNITIQDVIPVHYNVLN